jgi:flagellar assembly protein FliH
LSRIIKSHEAENANYTNYEYEDCAPESIVISDNIFPNFVDNVKIDFSSNKENTEVYQNDLEKQIEDKRKKADELKLKAEVYLQQAKERSETIFQESYEKGHKQGLDDGFKAGELKQKKLLDNYTQELVNLSKLREELIIQSEKSIINLVLRICKKILHIELSLNPELIRAIVKAGIDRAITPGQMKLRLNPDDAKYVQDNLGKIIGSTEIQRNIIIERDETIPRGSCIITNNYGDVDARLEEQLHEIEKECLKFID